MVDAFSGEDLTGAREFGMLIAVTLDVLLEALGAGATSDEILGLGCIIVFARFTILRAGTAGGGLERTGFDKLGVMIAIPSLLLFLFEDSGVCGITGARFANGRFTICLSADDAET